MTGNIANKAIVLQLNGNWQPIDIKTVSDAFVAMTSEGTEPSALALDIEYGKKEDGTYDFSSPTYMNPVGWKDWKNLPIRDYDLSIRTPTMEIRVPTILIAPNFRRMPTKKASPTSNNIFERDGGVCQYTGRKIKKSEGNLDHVIPRSKGGTSTWENLVWSDRSINSKKGNSLNHEVGLKLLNTPKAPPAKPLSFFITEAKHPTWSHFLLTS